MKPHPRIRKTIKWGGAAAVALLLYTWPLNGVFRVGSMRLSPHYSDLILFALLVPLAIATVGAWILDEIVVPAGTPVDPAKLRTRMRRAARVMVPLPLALIAAAATWHCFLAWRQANSLPGALASFWTIQMKWSCITAAVLWPVVAAFVYAFRPRCCTPGCCPKCSYDRAGIAKDVKCPECGSVCQAQT